LFPDLHFKLTYEQQAVHRCNTQIHSIVVALSPRVVVLIKDLNGNHVIQKCLNKLAPEDNQVHISVAFLVRAEKLISLFITLLLPTVLKLLPIVMDAVSYRCIGNATSTTCQRDQPIRKLRFSDGVIRQFAGDVCALSVTASRNLVQM